MGDAEGRACATGAVAGPPGIDAVAAWDGQVGDNRNALAIAALRDELTMAGGNENFNGFFNGMITDMGSAVRGASDGLEHQTDMVTHLENYRESISGVSLDEEMINLIRFQNAYNAAAQLISTTDEMLKTLVGMLG